MKQLTKSKSSIGTLLITAINKNYQMEVWTTITTTTTAAHNSWQKIKSAFNTTILP